MYGSTYFPDRRRRQGQVSISQQDFNQVKTDAQETKAIVSENRLVNGTVVPPLTSQVTDIRTDLNELDDVVRGTGTNPASLLSRAASSEGAITTMNSNIQNIFTALGNIQTGIRFAVEQSLGWTGTAFIDSSHYRYTNVLDSVAQLLSGGIVWLNARRIGTGIEGVPEVPLNSINRESQQEGSIILMNMGSPVRLTSTTHTLLWVQDPNANSALYVSTAFPQLRFSSLYLKGKPQPTAFLIQRQPMIGAYGGNPDYPAFVISPVLFPWSADGLDINLSYTKP